MRTTVRLDETLMHQVKNYAARHQRTLTSVMEDALRRLLRQEDARHEEDPVKLPVWTGSGLRPGIDIADRESWAHLLDSEDAAKLRAISDADA